MIEINYFKFEEREPKPMNIADVPELCRCVVSSVSEARQHVVVRRGRFLYLTDGKLHGAVDSHFILLNIIDPIPVNTEPCRTLADSVEEDRLFLMLDGSAAWVHDNSVWRIGNNGYFHDSRMEVLSTTHPACIIKSPLNVYAIRCMFVVGENTP